MDDLLRALVTACAMDNKFVPQDDVIDFTQGATHIPSEVTIARREGKKIIYHPTQNKWEMPDGSFVI